MSWITPYFWQWTNTIMLAHSLQTWGSDDEALAIYFDRLNDKCNDAILLLTKYKIIANTNIFPLCTKVSVHSLAPPIYGCNFQKCSNIVDTYYV